MYNRLKEQRKKKTLSQSQLSRISGVSRCTIGRIERGEYMPSLRIAMKLTKKMGLTIEDIFSVE